MHANVQEISNLSRIGILHQRQESEIPPKTSSFSKGEEKDDSEAKVFYDLQRKAFGGGGQKNPSAPGLGP